MRDLELMVRTELPNVPEAYYLSPSTVDRWDTGVELGPLNLRAWVYQERILSPRIPHFGAEPVFWKWRNEVACESLPVGMIKSCKQDGGNLTFYGPWHGRVIR